MAADVVSFPLDDVALAGAHHDYAACLCSLLISNVGPHQNRRLHATRQNSQTVNP